MKNLLLITIPERIFHWVNAVCFVALLISGFHVHYAQLFNVFASMDQAIKVHNFFGKIMVILFVVWVLYWLITGRIRYLVLRPGDSPANLKRQARFYLYGIFKGEAHPFNPTSEDKYNPLQKLAYIVSLGILAPVQIVTGVYLLIAISRWMKFDSTSLIGWSYVHVAAAFLSGAFIIIHMYMATTGHTVLANFKTMFTGRHETGESEDSVG